MEEKYDMKTIYLIEYLYFAVYRLHHIMILRTILNIRKEYWGTI